MSNTASQNNALKALLILHKAMLIGQILFAMVALFLIYSGFFRAGSPSLNKILQVFSISLSAGGFYLGTFLFKNKMVQALESKTVEEKTSIYTKACILQWALLEGPCLFVLVCFFIAGNYAFFALAIVLVVLFAMMGPSKTKMMFHLHLSEEEMANL